MDKKSQRLRDLMRNNYPPLRSDAANSFFDLNSGGDNVDFVGIRVSEKTGIAGRLSGGYVGVIGISTTEEIGVWGWTTGTGILEEAPDATDDTDKSKDGALTANPGVSVYGLTDGGTAGRFIAIGGGRGIVGSTDAAALAGIVARNTGGGPALTVETSYANFEAGLIVNSAGGATTASDTRIAGDTDANLLFVDASADKIGISTSAPTVLLDVGGNFTAGEISTFIPQAVAALGKNVDARTGMIFRNTSNGTAADVRWLLMDGYNDYFALAHAGYGNTGTLFGIAKGIQSTIFTYSATGTRHLVIGTYSSGDDVVFGTVNAERARLKGADLGIGTSAPNARLDVNGTTRLGDSDTNYAAFAADGELTLHGTARVEREFILPASGFVTGGAKPTETIDTNFLGYAFDLNDKGYFTFEVPSDWDPTSDIEVAIHWYSTEAYAVNSGEVRWAIIWSAVKEDGSEVISVNNTTTPSADINLPATAKRLVETKIHLPAASFEQHDVIGFQISRVALVDGNNPTAARAPVVVSAEIEYIADRLGLAT